MRAPAKYLFDSDFAATTREGKPTIGLVEHAQKLKEAEADAYGRGFAAANTAARADVAARTAAALERIAQALHGLDRSLAAVETKLATEAVEVAVAVARKLVPELLAREPFAEISALATECFRHLVTTPHVVVRVNDALQATAQQKLDEIVRACGLESRLVIMAEPDIALGDCRIEWADGGIVRDSAATSAAIGDAVASYIAARQGTAVLPEIPWSGR
jgi:flagellar assembly protein FliH